MAKKSLYDTLRSLFSSLKTQIDGKASSTHNHDSAYAALSHTHSQYLTSHQDISGKQDKTDNTLNTTAKTVVGAINELKSAIDAINARLHELRSYSSAFDNSFI